MDNVKPYKLPDGSIILKGKNMITCRVPKINVDDIVHEHFEITAELDSVQEADEKFETIAKQFPFSQSDLGDMAMVVSEAVNNAINNGPTGPDRKISLDVLYIPDVMFYVFVRDDLGKLEIEDLNFEISDVNKLDESGRGYFIMMHYCKVLALYFDDASGISSRQKEIILGFKPGSSNDSATQ